MNLATEIAELLKEYIEKPGEQCTVVFAVIGTEQASE
jgi:hypothetical protein